MQGNLHLGKYSYFISIKILVTTLTEHYSFKLVYLLQFMLGKLFAIGEAPKKPMCACVCVCVCVYTHLNMDDVEVERDHDTRKSSPRRIALLLSRMARVTSRGKRHVSTLCHTNLQTYLPCTSLFASFILLKLIRIKTMAVNALQPRNTTQQMCSLIH